MTHPLCYSLKTAQVATLLPVKATLSSYITWNKKGQKIFKSDINFTFSTVQGDCFFSFLKKCFQWFGSVLISAVSSQAEKSSPVWSLHSTAVNMHSCLIKQWVSPHSSTDVRLWCRKPLPVNSHCSASTDLSYLLRNQGPVATLSSLDLSILFWSFPRFFARGWYLLTLQCTRGGYLKESSQTLQKWRNSCWCQKISS